MRYKEAEGGESIPELQVEDISVMEKEESQEHYRALFNAMAEGFVLLETICDENGEPCDFRFLDVNPAFERLTGLNKEQVLGRTYSQVVSQKDLFLIETCGAVAISGKPTRFERYFHDLGRHFEATAYRTAPFQLAILFLDITQRRKMEDELRASEAKSRAILDSIPDMIFHVAEDGTFLDYRAPAGCELYVSPENFLGKRMDEVFPPDLARQAVSLMRTAKETSAVQAFEYRLLMGGRKIDYEARIVAGAEGDFVLLVRDISERRRMEQALLESERRLHAAVDSVPHCFVIYDGELRFRYANRAAVEMIGLSEKQIFGHTNEELFSPDIIKPYIDHLKKALDMRCTQKVEYTHDFGASGIMTFFTIYVPLLDEKGNVLQILVISHDITGIKEAERRLKIALEENKKQNRLLKTVIEEMKGNYEEIERLLYKISHDLMTPLITVEGFLDLLKKDVEKCNRIRIEIDLGLIGDAVSRMEILLGDALELSSLGMLSRPVESIPFEEIIDEAREHFKNTGTLSNLAIIEDEEFPSVYINRRRMVDVLVDMIEVCIKYSGECCSPRVHVGWRKQDDGPVFFTSCKGTGDSKDSSHDFKQCCDEESADNGTSIGLTISKKIIELQGGRMWMECSGAEGCTILFTLPQEARDMHR